MLPSPDWVQPCLSCARAEEELGYITWGLSQLKLALLAILPPYCSGHGCPPWVFVSPSTPYALEPAAHTL